MPRMESLDRNWAPLPLLAQEQYDILQSTIVTQPAILPQVLNSVNAEEPSPGCLAS